MLISRPYLSSQYNSVSLLWTAQRFPSVPPQALPQHGRVIMDDTDQVVIAAGFLYQSDSSICWLEWVVTDPKAAGQARHEALGLLLKDLLADAKQFGATHVFSSLIDAGLIKRYQAAGFSVSDTGMTNVIKTL